MKSKKKIISLLSISIISLGLVACNSNDIKKDEDKAISNEENKSNEDVIDIENELSKVKDDYKESIQGVVDKEAIKDIDTTSMKEKVETYSNKILNIDDSQLKDIEGKLVSVNNKGEEVKSLIDNVDTKSKEVIDNITNVSSKIEDGKSILDNIDLSKLKDAYNQISDNVN